MTLLLDSARLGARRAAVAGPLAPLARSLAAELRVAIAQVAPDGEPFVPPEKARMTRRGGRCPREGALLAFDPFEPRRHRCPVCGREYDDEEHYRWWILWYQLWLAERAVRGAVLYLLRGEAALGEFAARVLDVYAERYLAYPNRDNVLGPTRVFFSTYLESIWLLQLCVATDALEAADGDRWAALGARVRERVVAPSREVIAGYDERRSNRQVWNGAALQAAARMLGDAAAFDRALHAPSGLLSQLSESLLADGTWYEGENYHQFAHRGLWYAVTLADAAGAALPPSLVARFDDGFAAPFLTALPDFTLPARRDSQYAISLRQWRYAEFCELGLARRDDARLAGSLARIYDAGALPRRDTGRWRSAAESERNEPPTALSRADLGWRSLLHARPTIPDAGAWTPASVLLPAQGLAIVRRAGGRLYGALDYGHSGGGHGHPDRLNVLLSDGERRWLDDMGTGSYVERALHWYRSTLAHNAPLVDGRSQARVDGELLAWTDDGTHGWARARAAIAPGVVVRRTLVASADYLLDRLEWDADREVTLDLPLHVEAAPADVGEWQPATVQGAGGLEDGFDFLEEARSAAVDEPRVVALVDGDGRAVARAHVDGPATWFQALAPGAPGQGRRPFLFLRVPGRSGRITIVWDPLGVVADAEVRHARLVVRRVDGGVDEHGPVVDRWQIARTRGGRRERTVVLSGIAETAAVDPRGIDDLPPPTLGVTIAEGGPPWVAELARSHYRRSEPTWEEAGAPTARVTLAASGERLVVRVAVRQDAPHFMPPGAENELDNERADVNGDGLQLHVRPAPIVARREGLAWLLVPEGERGQVRATATTPAAGAVPLAAVWRPVDGGWEVECSLPLDALGPRGAPFLLDVIVNETGPGRERRRGQLVLSGGAGEFVYLQGDRHDPRVLVAVTQDARPSHAAT